MGKGDTYLTILVWVYQSKHLFRSMVGTYRAEEIGLSSTYLSGSPEIFNPFRPLDRKLSLSKVNFTFDWSGPILDRKEGGQGEEESVAHNSIPLERFHSVVFSVLDESISACLGKNITEGLTYELVPFRNLSWACMGEGLHPFSLDLFSSPLLLDSHRSSSYIDGEGRNIVSDS